MARNVFGNTDGLNTENNAPQKGEGLAPRKRVPLAARGATSQKYIGPSTEGQAYRTYQEIPLEQISASQARDRLSVDEDIDDLVQSIQRDGQQVPITVRIVNAERPYEIVVGRRRLAAMRKLAAAGQLENNTISAFVRKMDDQQAIIAQWVENNQRVNPSFIERALFLSEIEKAGFKPKVIQETIGIDESLVRKMRAIVTSIPEPLLTAIGPAPEAGRPQWSELKDICQKIGHDQAINMVDKIDASLRSKDRLAQVIALARPRPPAPTKSLSDLVKGHLSAKRSGPNLTFKVVTKSDQRFLSYLEERAPDLYREWTENDRDNQ
jgi:ParB family chromosome partitioning protein